MKNQIFKNVIVFIDDGLRIKHNNSFVPLGIIVPQSEVSVNKDFCKSSVLGKAKLKKRNIYIFADLELEVYILDTILDNIYPCPGGTYNNCIFRINQLSLGSSRPDNRVLPLSFYV